MARDNIFEMDWASQRESLAEHFAERAENASNYLLSSRASRRLHEETDEAEDEIVKFKVEIEKRFMLSVASKYYSFPYTELSFDNPFEDQDIADLLDKGVYSLYAQTGEEFQTESVRMEDSRAAEGRESRESRTQLVLQELRGQRSKFNGILEMIANRKAARAQHKQSRSKERKLGSKYGVIREQDEQLLRKRLYTQPYDKQAGFIVKKK